MLRWKCRGHTELSTRHWLGIVVAALISRQMTPPVWATLQIQGGDLFTIYSPFPTRPLDSLKGARTTVKGLVYPVNASKVNKSLPNRSSADDYSIDQTSTSSPKSQHDDFYLQAYRYHIVQRQAVG